MMVVYTWEFRVESQVVCIITIFTDVRLIGLLVLGDRSHRLDVTSSLALTLSKFNDTSEEDLTLPLPIDGIGPDTLLPLLPTLIAPS